MHLQRYFLFIFLLARLEEVHGSSELVHRLNWLNSSILFDSLTLSSCREITITNNMQETDWVYIQLSVSSCDFKVPIHCNILLKWWHVNKCCNKSGSHTEQHYQGFSAEPALQLANFVDLLTYWNLIVSPHHFTISLTQDRNIMHLKLQFFYCR